MPKMEQQLDLFTQKRFELMIDMATKKLQQEINSLKEHVSTLNKDIGSLKSQISRLQFEPQQANTQMAFEPNLNISEQKNIQQKKEVKIVDCRPESERKEEFQSVESERANRTHVGSAKNSEPLRPRYGDYKPEDVSIDKFFYVGRK